MVRAVPGPLAVFSPASRVLGLAVLLALAASGGLRGADTRPIVGPGATKEEVINAYGWPKGQSQLGTKEILNYPQGSVTLSNGRVERVDFSTTMPWPAPRPRPGTETRPAAPAAPKPTPAPVNPWITSLPAAMAQAEKQGAMILAAFTGSDWSPPSKRFITDVATHPDFVNPLMAEVVFLKLDFPTRVALPPELRQQNETLRARCGVTTYPALVFLSAAGEPLATVDLSKEPAGANYREFLIAAVTAERDRVKAQLAPPPSPPPANAVPATAPTPAPAMVPPPKPAAPPVVEKPSAAAHVSAPPEEVGAAMSTAAVNLMLGIGAGILIAAVILWWLWRRPTAVSAAEAMPRNLLTGLSRGSLPTVEELGTWPAERVHLLVAGLFEAGGYVVQPRASQPSEFDLTKADDPAVRVIVCCWSGAQGLAHAKAIRELSGALVAEDVANGWFVAIAGFSEEARAVARERGIALIDGADLLARLGQLPKMALMRIFSRAGA